MPQPLPRKLLLLMGGVCSLRPGHSYFAGATQLPLEARMTGIYGGFMLTVILFVVGRRVGARRIGSRSVLALLPIMFLSMVLDGVNSTLAEIGLPHLYTPTNLLRLITGLLSGIPLAVVLVWLWGHFATTRTASASERVLLSLWELLAVLGVHTGFVMVVVSEAPWIYYPVALLSAGGVVVLITGVALLALFPVFGLQGRTLQRRQLLAPAATALLLALVVVAGTAGLRWSMAGAL